MGKSEFHIYEFGRFRLYANDRILLRGDARVHLTEKVFNILLLLVQRSGHLVTKEELIEQVWPDAIIEENNLKLIIEQKRENWKATIPCRLVEKEELDYYQELKKQLNNNKFFSNVEK